MKLLKPKCKHDLCRQVFWSWGDFLTFLTITVLFVREQGVFNFCEVFSFIIWQVFSRQILQIALQL